MTSSTTTSPTESSRARAGVGGAARPGDGGIVIAFVPRGERAQQLTMRDRMSVTHWQTTAPLLGFDRLVIHPRRPGDPMEFGDIALVYRHDDPWACLGFTRQGERILAWNCVTGGDIGRFRDMNEALSTVLGQPAGQMESATVRPVRPGPGR